MGQATELMALLLAKQPYASYFVTQMCFDAARIERWLRDVRAAGVRLEPQRIAVVEKLEQRLQLMVTV
mgnify:CR=1 FL=1